MEKTKKFHLQISRRSTPALLGLRNRAVVALYVQIHVVNEEVVT
jgi:hypothetical protein